MRNPQGPLLHRATRAWAVPHTRLMLNQMTQRLPSSSERQEPGKCDRNCVAEAQQQAPAWPEVQTEVCTCTIHA